MGEIAYVRIEKGEQKHRTERLRMVAFTIFVVMALALLLVVLRSTYVFFASSTASSSSSSMPPPPPPGAPWRDRIAYVIQSVARTWATYFGNIATTASLWSALKTYGPVAGLLMYLYVVMHYMYKDGNDFYKSRIFYLTAFVVPFVLVLANQLIPFFAEEAASGSNNHGALPTAAAAATATVMSSTGGSTKYYLGVASVLFFALLINYLSNLPSDATVFRAAGFSSYVLFFLILMFGLSLLYNMFLVRTFRMKSWPGFLVGILFYLPCMVTDLFSYLTSQILGTPLSVYAIFVLELVFLLLYFYLPSWRNQSVRRLGVQVLVDPVEINQQRNISNYMDIFGEADKKIAQKTSLPYARTQFSMSFWVYLHQPKFMTTADSEAQLEILRFGNDVNPHPRFYFQVPKASSDGRFVMQWTNDPAQISAFSLPMQKWMHIFVNYGQTSYDVFVNGKLQTTMNRASDTLIDPNLFQTTDPLSIGDSTNGGMRGGIADMVFFPMPLKHNEIEVLARSREEQPPTER